jgi:uncharacterized protein (TIGR01777 family)
LPSLAPAGYEVSRLVRRPSRNPREISWNPYAEVDPEAVSGFEAVIHLSGESIMGRWTKAKKQALRESRVTSTRNLSEALAQATQRPLVLVCASAIGIYGDRGDEVLTEDSTGGTGFLAELSRDWEAASRIAAEAGIRTINIRTGLVLSNKGGALTQMLTPFKLGVGGRVGSGRQWWSWIHIADVVGAVLHGMNTQQLSGPVNLTAPEPVTNADFTRVLAEVLRRPAILPVPALALRLAFGEMAEEVLLSSQRALPKVLQRTDYSFQFTALRQALTDLLR